VLSFSTNLLFPPPRSLFRVFSWHGSIFRFWLVSKAVRALYPGNPFFPSSGILFLLVGGARRCDSPRRVAESLPPPYGNPFHSLLPSEKREPIDVPSPVLPPPYPLLSLQPRNFFLFGLRVCSCFVRAPQLLPSCRVFLPPEGRRRTFSARFLFSLPVVNPSTKLLFFPPPSPA